MAEATAGSRDGSQFGSLFGSRLGSSRSRPMAPVIADGHGRFAGLAVGEISGCAVGLGWVR